MEDRYNADCMIITSQAPVNKWYELNQEKILADVIMPASQQRGTRSFKRHTALNWKVNPCLPTGRDA